MGREPLNEGGGYEPRMTRRAVIATGGTAYAASVLGGSTAFAQPLGPAQQVSGLRDRVRGSTVDDQLKSRVLTVIARVENDLADGHNTRARTVVEKELLPLLLHNSEHHGLSAKLAREWVADSRKLLSAIPRRNTHAAPNGAHVHVFNCYSEPIVGMRVNGDVVGDFPGWQPPGYVPGEGPGIRRSKEDSYQSFANGDNSVVVPWVTRRGNTRVYIPGPDRVSFDEDLVLLVTVERATLLTSRGGPLKTFEIDSGPRSRVRTHAARP
jgi:hypothetical protein